MKIVILSMLIYLHLFSNETRNCTKKDLIGGTWIVSHSTLFDKTADQTKGSYVNHFLKSLQLLRYMDNNEVRTLYTEVKPEHKSFELFIKLLDYPDGDLFSVDINGVITVRRTNGEIAEKMSCKCYIKSIPKVNIAKGSIYLLRYNGDKPLVGNIYQRIPSSVIKNITKNKSTSI